MVRTGREATSVRVPAGALFLRICVTTTGHHACHINPCTSAVAMCGLFRTCLTSMPFPVPLHTQLAPLVGGVGKRGDRSRLTLAKIVRGIATGDVRKHLDMKEQQFKVSVLIVLLNRSSVSLQRCARLMFFWCAGPLVPLPPHTHHHPLSPKLTTKHHFLCLHGRPNTISSLHEAAV